MLFTFRSSILLVFAIFNLWTLTAVSVCRPAWWAKVATLFTSTGDPIAEPNRAAAEAVIKKELFKISQTAAYEGYRIDLATNRSNGKPVAQLFGRAVDDKQVLDITGLDVSNANQREPSARVLIAAALKKNPTAKVIAIRMIRPGSGVLDEVAGAQDAAYYQEAFESNPDSVRGQTAYRAAAALGFTQVNWKKSGVAKRNNYYPEWYYLYLERPPSDEGQ